MSTVKRIVPLGRDYGAQQPLGCGVWASDSNSFRFEVSGCGLRVSCYMFLVSYFVCRSSCDFRFGFLVWSLGSGVRGVGFGFGFQVSVFGLRVSYFVSWVGGLGFRGLGLGFRVSSFVSKFSRARLWYSVFGFRFSGF